MNTVKVTINGISYEMIFNLKLIRVLGHNWGLPDIPSTMAKVAQIESLATGSFEAYDVMYDIIFFAISCNKNNPEIDRDSIEDLSTNDFVQLAGQMTVGITSAFPDAEQPDETKKKIAPKPKNLKPGMN